MIAENMYVSYVVLNVWVEQFLIISWVRIFYGWGRKEDWWWTFENPIQISIGKLSSIMKRIEERALFFPQRTTKEMLNVGLHWIANANRMEASQNLTF